MQYNDLYVRLKFINIKFLSVNYSNSLKPLFFSFSFNQLETVGLVVDEQHDLMVENFNKIADILHYDPGLLVDAILENRHGLYVRDTTLLQDKNLTSKGHPN